MLKIETTTAMLAAMLRSDPVAGLADAWGYLMQVENLLARPEAEARFGQSARQASETLGLAEVQFRNLVTSVQGGRFAESFPAYLRRWADGHPIEGGLSRRPPIDDALAELLSSSRAEGVFAALGDLDEMMPDVMTRMDLYTTYLPRLARWEAELAADDLTRGIDSQTLIAEFELLARAADRMATVAETASDLVARERTAVVEALRGERVAIFGEVKNQRIATLHEVEAIAQRLTDRSSGPLRDAFVSEMSEVLKKTEEMRKHLIMESGQALDRVVDHAFLRLVELLLVCAGLFVLGLVLRRFLSYRR